ncbi:alpha,alpha-trehalase [Romeria aff. gracilis LEGE 07310]|uniref:Alpha,alpha-trehalase n=1 Tax=Vasconcelosia minhoensis LEGE 07310 TaxID=915328 RepID=A0A8J7AWT1_9CYAN|nr:trehalase family glycosidase [Romeria gracilis]MBE9080334.1 alpha,alpha-trehalase [Romeria aff. gracilis LEGE 07310]
MVTVQPQACPYPTADRIQAVRKYIKKTWQTLRRTHSHILEAAQDIKVEHTPGRWVVYVPVREDLGQIEKALQAAMPVEEFDQIQLEVLPVRISQVKEHGLLYLPGDYVVPGGRFNEMYGWDSYFIQLGLLRDGEYALAQSLVDQLLYQVKHYGTVLNANRTYFFNRSQPPFLSRMVLEMYGHTRDRDWLQATVAPLRSYYYYWLVPPHFNQETGLSRYYSEGEGPAPEVLYSERDEAGRTHFDRVRDYYRRVPVDDYDVSLFYNRTQDRLTDLFYKGDRSMRESGLDPTNRFGPFSVDIISYAPVCLNVLLYQMELDMAEIDDILGHPSSVSVWRKSAEQRRKLIDQYLWDEASGLYLDYNFGTGQRRPYEFATTFYPLWAGLASPQQAQRLVENLPRFEAAGGIRTSNNVSGSQWDAPFGWAPLQLMAAQGLRRYGYRAEADRIAHRFLALAIGEYDRCGCLLEKYNIEHCTGEVSAEIQFGYSTNEIGFGWTNGVVLELLALLD